MNHSDDVGEDEEEVDEGNNTVIETVTAKASKENLGPFRETLSELEMLAKVGM